MVKRKRGGSLSYSTIGDGIIGNNHSGIFPVNHDVSNPSNLNAAKIIKGGSGGAAYGVTLESGLGNSYSSIEPISYHSGGRKKSKRRNVKRKNKSKRRHVKSKTKRRSKSMKGGHVQFLSGTPFSQSYGIDVNTSSQGGLLANPPHVNVNNINNTDNYNHKTGLGSETQTYDGYIV